jgi:hypothetical protein
LQDLWVYNLNRLQWAAPAAEPQPDAAEGGDEEGAALLAPAGPPASAGWSVTPFQDKLLVLGGHVKVGKVGTDSSTWQQRVEYTVQHSKRCVQALCCCTSKLLVLGGHVKVGNVGMRCGY